jgi:hypothetical protein
VEGMMVQADLDGIISFYSSFFFVLFFHRQFPSLPGVSLVLDWSIGEQPPIGWNTISLLLLLLCLTVGFAHV